MVAASSSVPAARGPGVYGTYVDEVLGYRQTVGGVASVYYPHGNHLYSVAALTNAAGQVVERYSYTAYGKQTITSPTGVVRQVSAVGFDRGFTGYVADNETGDYYARTRMYSPTLGRFLARDMWSSRHWSLENPTYYHWLDARWGKVYDHLPMTHGPSPMDGYVDGYNTYAGYFAPNGKDPYGLANCEELIYLGHNDKVPQKVPGSPGVPADPTGGCNGGCSAYAIYSCAGGGTADPAVPKTWIPGAPPQTEEGNMGVQAAATAAEAAFNKAVANAPNLCKGKCNCKSIHIEVICRDPFSGKAGWIVGVGWPVCNLKKDVPCP